ncbi:MAG: hypothetical protein CL867_07060, partial [Cytophagaceae bacterium]|nr:hypothetical protein [Cytophagaceae bacterium]
MKIFNRITLGLFAILMLACSEDDKTVDQVIANTERGAVLRTVEIIENSIPIAIENGQTQTAENAQLSLLLEEQDVENGALLQSVDVFIQFTDGSPDTGDSSAAITDEVFVKNISREAFT